MWVEIVMEGGRRFMAAWRKKEEVVGAARHRQGNRETTRLVKKLLSHTKAENFAEKRHLLLAYSGRVEGIRVHTRDGPRPA